MTTHEDVYFALVEECNVYDDVASKLCEKHATFIENAAEDNTADEIAESILSREREELGEEKVATYYMEEDEDEDEDDDWEDDYLDEDDEDEDDEDVDDDVEWED